jgi:uncharacterized protein involved in exopolysaccharide biosynthesis
VLLRQWRLIVGLPLAMAFVVVVMALLAPRQYTAGARFTPQESSSPQSGLSQLASQFGIAAPKGMESTPQFYAELLLSREVLREVVKTHYEAARPTPFRGTLVDYFGVAGSNADEAVLQAVRLLRTMLIVRTDRNVGIVSFQVFTKYPDLSMKIVNRFLELVNSYNLERRRSQARAEREFMEQQVGQARTDLTTAEDALAAFYARNRRFQDAPELVAGEARLQRQVSLRQQLYVTLSQSLAMARIEEVRSTPVVTILEHPEGFVEPQRRGLITRGISALLVGELLALAIAFVLSGMSQTRDRDRNLDEYREFDALRRQITARLSGTFRRRPDSSRGVSGPA